MYRRPASCQFSSPEISLLRGVLEKSRILDARNFTFHGLQGVGSLGAGLLNIAAFGKSFAPSVAEFNGPFLTAFGNLLPDFTVNYANRLNDSAYGANLVVPKQQAKVFVVFVPQRIFLKEAQQKQFWKEPTLLWGEGMDFRKLEVIVNGSFVTEAELMPPTITSAFIDSEEMKKFQDDKPEVRGHIYGQFLGGAGISLTEPKSLSVASSGTPSDKSLEFVVRSDQPVPPDTVLRLVLSKKEGSTTVPVAINYLADPPQVVGPPDPDSGKQGETVTVTVNGKKFIPGVTNVQVSGLGVQQDSVSVESGSLLKATLKIAAGAATGERKLTVTGPGGKSDSIKFTVKAKG